MILPVVMYHSISDNSQWLWGHLACPVKVFEDHARTLAEWGFTTISLDDLYRHACHGYALPKNPVVLTFDDGYLDNWVYAFPILNRYGLQGTIFVNPEFVDPSDKPRPNLDDVTAGTVRMSDLNSTGFLSWAEMRAMEAAGVMDIQSHAMAHTWYFASDRIVDWHHPGDSYPWLAWNARPERKYLWLSEDQSLFVPWGAPVYEHEKALIVRRYFPDPKLTDWLAQQVASQGGESFFAQRDWRGVLTHWSAQYQSQYPLDGRWESDEEYQARIRYEVGASKEVIEANLRKRVNFLCWPGGGYNETAERVAREIGYLAVTLSSRDPRRVAPDPEHIKRWGAPTLPVGRKNLYRDGRYLVYRLHCQRGEPLYCLGCKLLTVRDILSIRAQQAVEFFTARLARNSAA